MPRFAGDQRQNARRVEELGAGIHVDASQRTIFECPHPDVLATLPAAIERTMSQPCYRAARWSSPPRSMRCRL
jgi:UDP:flavonoid glycosyltransferase YjiC (YdhE family)